MLLGLSITTCRPVTRKSLPSRSKKKPLAPVSGRLPSKVETRTVVNSSGSIMVVLVRQPRICFWLLHRSRRIVSQRTNGRSRRARILILFTNAGKLLRGNNFFCAVFAITPPEDLDLFENRVGPMPWLAPLPSPSALWRHPIFSSGPQHSFCVYLRRHALWAWEQPLIGVCSTRREVFRFVP